MYTVMGRRLRKEGSGTIRPFFKAWCSNLKISTLFWVPQLFVTVSMGMTLVLNVPVFFRVAALVILLLATMVCSTIYPQIARFRNRRFAYLRNAVILLVLRLGWVVLNLLLFLSPVFLFLLSPGDFLRFGFLWLLLGFSGLFLLSAELMQKILAPLEELSADRK